MDSAAKIVFRNPKVGFINCIESLFYFYLPGVMRANKMPQ